MRALVTCIAALGLAAAPVFARANGTGDNDSSAAAASKSSTSAASNSTSSAASANASPANAEPAPSSLELESELHQMRELLESQTRQLEEQQEKMAALESALKAAKIADPNAADPNAADPNADPALSSSLTNNSNGAQGNPDEPASLHFKGVTLTPGGFMAAESVWRQKALASDVNTPLGSIPFDGSSNAHMSEFQASGRQSRISMLVEGKLSDVKIGGYYEADFLSAGTTSNNNQSNSYTLRQRQFFAQAAFESGFTFTGGQQWSLLTETTKGMDNRSEALPMTIDAQYNVGFSWARQFGARITKNFNNKVWLGLSVEEAQVNSIGVHGQPTAATAVPTLACTTPGTNNCSSTGTYTLAVNPNPAFNNYLVGAFGTSGGLYNPVANYGYNMTPDFVVKAVFEPGFGHYEIFGVAGAVHDRVFPCVPITGTTAPAGCPSITSGLGAFNSDATTGGVGANARWNLFAKKVDLGVHFLGGTGIGRYGSGGLADVTVRPDGTIVPLHNYQALGTFQLHPTPKLDIYMNVGGEYEAKAEYQKTPGGPFNEGYGAVDFANSGCWNETLPVTGPSTSSNIGVPSGVGGGTGYIPGPLGSCTGDTRSLLEGTLGFWYRFYSGPKGRFQYGMQYSNIYRNTWEGTRGTITATDLPNNGQPHGDENMVFTSFRYYLP